MSSKIEHKLWQKVLQYMYEDIQLQTTQTLHWLQQINETEIKLKRHVTGMETNSPEVS